MVNGKPYKGGAWVAEVCQNYALENNRRKNEQMRRRKMLNDIDSDYEAEKILNLIMEG